MSLFAADGCWTWFNSPEASYDPVAGAILVGAISSAGAVRIHKYKLKTKRLQSSSIDTGITVDDHSNPVIIRLADDTPSNPDQYLMLWSLHNGAQYARISRLTNSIVSLTAEDQLNASGNPAYVDLVQLGDTARSIYHFFRESSGNPPTLPWGRAFRVSTDGGNNWDSDVEFFIGATNSNRPYPQYARHSSGTRVDVFMGDGHPTDIRNRIHHFYFTVDASGNRSWFQSDGTAIGSGDSELPLVAADVTTVLDDANINAWLWDAAWVNGVLTVAYAHPTSGALTSWASAHTYRIARYTGGSWVHEDVCDAGGTSSDGLYAGEPAYSGGICLDETDANAVYVSRKYGSTDFRVEKWTKSGTWSKAVDISGNTSSVNARPRRIVGYTPSSIIYWRGTYTSYNSYSTDIHVYPDLTINALGTKVKPSKPAWRANEELVTGVNHYYPLHEGTGTTVADLVPSGAQNGSFTGSPTWGTGTLGPHINGFTTSAYVAIDPSTQPVATGTYPWWFAVLVTNTSTAAQGWPISFGNSGSANTTIGFRLNEVADRVGAFIRDDAGASAQINFSSSPINDGNPHVLMWIQWAANSGQFYVDGALIGDSTTTLGTITLNRFSLGVLRRNTVGNPHTGEVIAAACGEDGAPDPFDLSDDWRSGNFIGIRPLAGLTAIRSGASMGIVGTAGLRSGGLL